MKYLNIKFIDVFKILYFHSQCPQCSKAFINASFLNAHVARRHPEYVNQLVPSIGQMTPPTPQPANNALERQLLDIQQRLIHTEAQLVEERNARNTVTQKVCSAVLDPIGHNNHTHLQFYILNNYAYIMFKLDNVK